MTARGQLRRGVGVDRSDAGRGLSAEPGPTVPERLYAARRRKGVNLDQAERETKIRGRYLAALERGDYWALPGSVYAKGFLRNYASYLGLDPDDVLSQWRLEVGGARDAPIIAVPRPIAASRKRFTFSTGMLVIVLLAIVVVGFAAYLGVQVLRFAKPPTISVTDPPSAVLEVGA